MKSFFTFFLLSLFQISAFAQIEDHWPEICENVTFTYNLNEGVDNPLEDTLTVEILNIGSDTIFNYCDAYTTPSSGVTLVGNENCYPQLIPNATKLITIVVMYADTTINCFDLDFKIKNGDPLAPNSDNEYCFESTQFCKNTPLSVEEINRENMTYASTYYDLLGRVKRQPLTKGFYIEQRVYEDGYESLDKVYINP